ncbi:hypothetical protein PMAYCL1PPCAC_13018, partial [Pristionchus mayeri]
SIMPEKEVTMKLASGSEIRYLSQWAIDSNVCQSEFSEEPFLRTLERSDLTTHVYEGGLKVWECSKDLCELIEAEAEIVKGKNIVELGCGGALPSIMALHMGAKTLWLQDFNAAVLACFTMENLKLNGVESGDVHCVAAPWNGIRGQGGIPPKSAEVVLSSETIYNEEDYPHLHDAIVHVLKDDGIALIAGKMIYFGLSGSVPSFADYVKSRGILSVKEKKIIQASVPRIILELARV